MLIRYPVGEIYEFEVQGRVGTGNINLGGVSVLMEYKTPNLDEIERVVQVEKRRCPRSEPSSSSALKGPHF